MPEPVESEIKLRIDSAEEARRQLQRLGAWRTAERHFEDNLLLDDDRLSLGSRGCALRIRRAAGDVLLTYKGPRQVVEGVKRRLEIETAAGDADALQALLAALGFRPVFRYQKYREAYRWGELEIVVDETPIGSFLEIEGPLPAIHAAAAALGRAPADYIAESYGALFLASGGSGDMVF